MKIEKIFYSSHFAHAFQKLPRELRKKAVLKEEIFRQNCFDLRLKTHKLKGELELYWSFSLDYSNRILFEFLEDGAVAFIDVGNHSVYK